MYICRALVAHTCNPSYSENRDEDDHHLKPFQENSSTRPYPKKKNPSQKSAGGVAQGVGL
jgi:hypothetical protein